VLDERKGLDMAKVRINPRESSGVPLGQVVGGAEVRISDTLAPPRCAECERRDEVILAEARQAARYKDGLSAVAYEVGHARALIGASVSAQNQAAHAIAVLSRLAALCEALGVPS
jgi:hypothetical protein